MITRPDGFFWSEHCQLWQGLSPRRLSYETRWTYCQMWWSEQTVHYNGIRWLLDCHSKNDWLSLNKRLAALVVGTGGLHTKLVAQLGAAHPVSPPHRADLVLRHSDFGGRLPGHDNTTLCASAAKCEVSIIFLVLIPVSRCRVRTPLNWDTDLFRYNQWLRLESIVCKQQEKILICLRTMMY